MTTKNAQSTRCFTDVGGTPSGLQAYLEQSVEQANVEIVFDVSDQLLPNLTQCDLQISVSSVINVSPPEDNPEPAVKGFLLNLSGSSSASQAQTRYSTAGQNFSLKRDHPAATNAVGSTLTFDLLSGANGVDTITSGPSTLMLFVFEGSSEIGTKGGTVFTNPQLIMDGGDIEIGTDTGCASKIQSEATTRFSKAGAPFFIDDQLGMGWYAYPYSPEGALTANKGSICQTPIGVYRKTTSGSVNTGWVKL